MNDIERLAERARGEKAPRVSVSASVIAGIRVRTPDREDAPFRWIALISGLSASLATLALIPVYREWTDPLVALFLDLSWGLL